MLSNPRKKTPQPLASWHENFFHLNRSREASFLVRVCRHEVHTWTGSVDADGRIPVHFIKNLNPALHVLQRKQLSICQGVGEISQPL